MTAPNRVLAVVLAGGSLVALSGCAIDRVLWGSDGASVIAATEQLVAAAPSGGQGALACEDSAVLFGDAGVWNGLDAGEPERSDSATFVDRPGLDATWRINLEGAGIGDPSGVDVPTDVFYRETENGLCVAGVIWQTVDLG